MTTWVVVLSWFTAFFIGVAAGYSDIWEHDPRVILWFVVAAWLLTAAYEAGRSGGRNK